MEIIIIAIIVVFCFIIYKISTEKKTDELAKQQCEEQETLESIIENENVVHKKSLEDNGEGYIMTFAKVWLILFIIGAVIIFIAGIVVANELFGYNWLIFLYFLAGSAITVILGFLTYFTVKVYTNISRKATAIYQLLDDRLEKQE